MAFWTFSTDRQGWGGSDDDWIEEDGHPAGCIKAGRDVSDLSISVTPDSPASFWCRIIWDDPGPLEGPLEVGISLTSNDSLLDISGSRTISVLPYDSGWFKVFGNAADTGTITSLGTTIAEPFADWPGLVYVDSIYVAETEPEDSEARFYQGINSLAERFEMPFSDVSAPALALRQDGAVAIGNGTPGETEIIVIFAGNYTTFDDQTYDHAAEGVQRTLWVK